MTTRTLVPVAAVLLIATSAALAQTTPDSRRGKAEDRQQAVPSNQAPGGQVDRSGIADTAPKNYLWDRLDANEDNFISPSEAAIDDGVARQFRFLDTNKDLKLDATEFSAYEPAPSTKKDEKK
jgi:hypothetical protein